MLELMQIGYSYPFADGSLDGETPVLDQVSLTVRAGERVAVLGPNGSGKSTLLRCAATQVDPTRGSIVLDGRRLETAEDGRYLRSRVGIVAQDPDNQIVASTVFEEVAFGPCNLGLPVDEVYEAVDDALTTCDLADYGQREVASLSGGQRQRLAIAGVLAMRPAYVLLDEPCSMLDQAARRRIGAVVESVAKDGAGVLYVTHELAEVIGFDRLVILEHGRVIWQGTPGELLGNACMLARSRCLLSPWLACARELMALGLLDSHGPLADPEACGRRIGILEGDLGVERAQNAVDDVLAALVPGPNGCPEAAAAASGLCGENLLLRYAGMDRWALQVASVRVGPGDVLLIAGKTGSGKSTLAQVLAGLLDAEQGTVLVDGSPVRPGMVGYAFQRAEDQLFADTVAADVAFGPRNLGRDGARATADAEAVLCLVGLDPRAYGDRSPFALSGGQMRRVALAGVLAMKPAYVIFDEPTVGLDAQGVEELTAIIGSLTAQGTGVLLVSHDVERMAPLATGIIVLEEGGVAWQGSPGDFVGRKAAGGNGACGFAAIEDFLRGLHGSR